MTPCPLLTADPMTTTKDYVQESAGRETSNSCSGRGSGQWQPPSDVAGVDRD
jgi:hypothetical protein